MATLRVTAGLGGGVDPHDPMPTSGGQMVLVGADDILGMLGVTGRTPRDLDPVGAVGHDPVAEDAVFLA